MSDEPLIEFIRRRLKEEGADRWPAIAEAVSAGLPPDRSVSAHLLRKIAYGDRKEPRLPVVEALLSQLGYQIRPARVARKTRAAA